MDVAVTDDENDTNPRSIRADRAHRADRTGAPVTEARRSPSLLMLLAALAAASAASCVLVYESEFLLRFDAESETRAQLVAIEYEVRGSDGTTESTARVRAADVGGIPTSALPIRPLDGDWHRSFLVTARALREADDGSLEPFNERSFRATFAPRGKWGRQEYTLRFSDDCILFDLVCGPDETCIEGRCGPIPYVSPEAPREGEALRTVRVETAPELVDAMEDARFGDEIVVAPGTYEITANLWSRAGGSEGAPIVVRAEEPGTVFLRYTGAQRAEVFSIVYPYWVIDGLDVIGACPSKERCDHAVHVSGAGAHVILRNNRFVDFNQVIHVNRASDGRTPDDGTIEGNVVEYTSARTIGATVTGIRFYGASRWVIRDNVFRDIAHTPGGPYAISYGMYVVGTVDGVVFERNRIEFNQGVTDGGSYVGFGVNTTNRSAISGLVFRNNTVSEGGVELRSCTGCRIEHSTIGGGVAIGVDSSATTIGNLVSGAITVVSGSTLSSLDDESERPLAELVVDPATDLRPRAEVGSSTSDVTEDFCGGRRPSRPTRGALEPTSSCDGLTPSRLRRLP